MNFRISFAICKVVTSAESSPIKETGKRKKVESSASRKLFEEDSTDRECHGTSLKLTPEVWAGIPVQEVKSLPYDIDGVQIFRLNYDRADKMATTLDGRQWSGYITSRRSGFVGKRFIKSCKGSHRCGNELCGYFRQFKKMNRVHFEKKGSVVKCSTCGATAEFVPCPCKKIWEYPDGDAKVTVYHYGTHTCVPIKRAPSTTAEVTAAFQLSRTLKPERLVNDKLIEAIEKEESLQDIEDLADSLVDRNALRRMKYTAKEKLEPVGHSYDAVMQYKEKVKKLLQDPFLIYRVDCERRVVFKTSKEQLQLAIEMHREGEGHLKVEPCHVDGKHNRATGYITISLVVYDTNLREMTKIATMECLSESKENVGLFWSFLNSALKQYTGNNEYVFKPHLYVFDEGGGFWASLQDNLGPEEVQRAVSCERHWWFSVDRNANKLIGEDVKEEYKFLCSTVLKSSTRNMYDKAKVELEKFIDKHPFLSNWWKWWDARRSHVFRAFKPGFNVAKSNLAEVHHSRWHHISAENLTLIQACREDVAESIKLKRRLEGYRLGAYSGGRGPSADELQRRRHLDQKKQAAEFCKELDDYVEGGEEMHLREPERFVDEKSSHRHDPFRKAGREEEGASATAKNQILTNASHQKETHGAASSSVP
ncbi:unnamed protein product [Porites lobata]|uniref:MULE transposase domain-containing protein n=1 Tax=Porites lobata TaxID=104759 RepID=A0ABN8QJH6_9CNID|nr:unnamed protein product [Porites lobata]